MDIADYAARAATTWFLGFFPLFEIYVAVPAGIAMGLDYVSAVAWAVFGNFVPVPLIIFGYDQMQRVAVLRRWLQRARSERFARLINRYGTLFILVITPWTGVWAAAGTARVLGMSRGRLLFYSFASITIYAVVLAAGIAFGIDVFFT